MLSLGRRTALRIDRSQLADALGLRVITLVSTGRLCAMANVPTEPLGS